MLSKLSYSHYPYPLYVTVFAKRDHLGANLDFEFCIWSESTLDDLPVARR